MKCFYYLTSTLENTREIIDELHKVGINDWFIHVLSKDEAGIKKVKVHASNYLERLDILRFGILGATAGLIVGIIAAILVNSNNLFGQGDLPNIAYYSIIGFFTLFGTWEGGFIGIATENKKTSLFHDDLESGGYLILIYTKEVSENVVKTVMEKRNQDVTLVAIDENFYNPLVGLKRV